MLTSTPYDTMLVHGHLSVRVVAAEPARAAGL